MQKSRQEIEKIAESVVDSMLKVHRTLGPGLLESTYQACLAHELRSRGVEVSCEVDLPVQYDEIELEAGYRIDMLVAECIIVENKSVQTMPPVFEAKLLTYLKLSGNRLGFLVNWNVPLIKDGIKRMVNGIGACKKSCVNVRNWLSLPSLFPLRRLSHGRDFNRQGRAVGA